VSGRLTAYPPDFVGPIGEGYRCNDGEWVASTLNKGDRCWFRKQTGWFGPKNERKIGPWKIGTFMFSYFYDGVIARVYEDDPDDYIEHSLFCDLGDELRATAP
jgi:hypothetical protein